MKIYHEYCLMRHYVNLEVSFLFMNGCSSSDFRHAYITEAEYTTIKDLSMMYRALWDQNHEGAMRISQYTGRIAPYAQTYPSSPRVHQHFIKLQRSVYICTKCWQQICFWDEVPEILRDIASTRYGIALSFLSETFTALVLDGKQAYVTLT